MYVIYNVCGDFYGGTLFRRFPGDMGRAWPYLSIVMGPIKGSISLASGRVGVSVRECVGQWVFSFSFSRLHKVVVRDEAICEKQTESGCCSCILDEEKNADDL